MLHTQNTGEYHGVSINTEASEKLCVHAFLFKSYPRESTIAPCGLQAQLICKNWEVYNTW